MFGTKVMVHFGADEARRVAVPRSSFILWYGRDVGRGEVLEVVNETAKEP